MFEERPVTTPKNANRHVKESERCRRGIKKSTGVLREPRDRDDWRRLNREFSFKGRSEIEVKHKTGSAAP